MSQADAGFLSVSFEYVLLPLVNKEAASAYSRAEYSQAGRDTKREWAESRRHQVAAEGDRHRILISKSQLHADTQVSRNG